jgi:competence protein ComEC
MAPLCGWLAGTAWHLQGSELASAATLAGWGLGAMLAVVLAGRCREGHGWSRGGLLWVAGFGLAIAVCGVRAHWQLEQRLPERLEGVELLLEADVAAMPQRTDTGWRLQLDHPQAWTRDPGGQRLAVDVPARLMLSWYLGPSAPESVAAQPIAGDRWRWSVRLHRPRGLSNPGGFDYELWLWERGIGAVGSVRASGPPPERLSAGWGHPIERLRQASRDAIDQALRGVSAAGVIAALVLGDQAAIDRPDWDLFRVTGVAHLMAISGLHITMFSWLATAWIGWLWRRSARLCLAWPAPQAALLAGLVLASGYALFSGWAIPAQRTICMLAVVTLLRCSGLRWPWWQTWVLTAAVVVAVDPWAMLQAGFWLSFVAVGVLFASTGPSTGEGWRGVAWRLLREQMVITLALAPLTLLLFQQVSVVGLLANLIAIPWVTCVITPLAMMGLAWAPLWQFAAVSVEVLMAVLRPLGAWPGAVFEAAAAPWPLPALALLGGVLLVLRLPWRWRAWAVPLCLPALLWQSPRPAPGAFELVAADIGQGNAVLVRTATHALLYDAGPRYSPDSDAGARVLVPMLRHAGERLDRVVISHRDSDHAGGAAAVLTASPGARLLASLEPEHPLWAMAPGEPCEAGQRWVWDDVRFEVLHPPAVGVGAGALKPNTVSCVLKVSAGGRAALLTGDIERAQESALVASGAVLDADVLLVPHHGSRSSSSEAFIDAVRPRQAWIQAGHRNRYGHPAPDVVERYRSRGIAIMATTACGQARWSSTAPEEVRCHRALARRYWHAP